MVRFVKHTEEHILETSSSVSGAMRDNLWTNLYGLEGVPRIFRFKVDHNILPTYAMVLGYPATEQNLVTPKKQPIPTLIP